MGSRMKRVGIIGLVAASLGGAVVSGSLALASHPTVTACGGSSWRLTTLSDQDRAKVILKPRSTTIGAIVARGTPSPLPRRRTTPFQRQTWQVIAQIAEYHLSGDVIHLALSDDNTYVDGAIPAPSCVPSTSRVRSSIVRTWTKFTSDCGHPTEKSQPLGAVAYITGIGSWTSARGHGLAPNGAALSPVTGLRIVAGCG
jgi:hypothetical protein